MSKGQLKERVNLQEEVILRLASLIRLKEKPTKTMT